MTELVPNEAVPGLSAGDDGGVGSRPKAANRLSPGLMLGALGVVYGDIGTSPLYCMQAVFAVDNGLVAPTPVNVFGVVSLLFWSITLVVSIKYVALIMRADNDGEGGVMALGALARELVKRTSRNRAWIVMLLGVLGASLFYGDSVITPAISVLSAVEGLNVVSPRLTGAVLPLATAIIIALFAIQRRGTSRVGKLFGPVMLVWFASLAVAGFRQVVRHPRILLGLSPSYAIEFIALHPFRAFIAMGAVVLSITGAEALYADMGHFGRPPIRWTWFLVVFPALTLNYLAQASLILQDPSARTNPLFLLVPHWAQLPMVVLATAATVIASQAVISGAFSLSRQAVRLGFLPRMRIVHTSAHEAGQVYLPAINWLLLLAVVAVTLAFRSSSKLASAYGVAVTATFLITTALFLVVARHRWHWRAWQLALVATAFGGTEATFLIANLTKVTHGGWLTILIAAMFFTIMVTWWRGREILTARRIEKEGSLDDFIADVHAEGVIRVPGTAIFPHSAKGTVPLALRTNIEHNHVLHERVIIIYGRTRNIPHIPWSERLTVDHLDDPVDGIIHVTVDFGFQDRTDFPEVVRRLSEQSGEGSPARLDPESVSYFLSRVTVGRTRDPELSAWRKYLFIGLTRMATGHAEFLRLPAHRVVILGSHIDI